MSTEQLRAVLASMSTTSHKPTGPALIARVAKLGFPLKEAAAQLEHCIERGLIRVTNHRKLSLR